MEKRLLLAVGEIGFENFIEEKLKDTHAVVGKLTYKDRIVEMVQESNPDILLLRETLSGNADILSIIYQLSGEFPDLRIIFIGKDRSPGDSILSTLVSYKVYDIIPQGKLNGNEVIDLILNPNSFADVKHYLPRASYEESEDKVVFEAPDMPERIIYKQKDVDAKEIKVGESVHQKKREQNAGRTFPEEVEEIQKDRKTSFLDKISFKLPIKKEEKDNKVAQMKGGTGKQIISFVGGKGGVGTTSLAFNTSLGLANLGKKVLFVELNDFAPSSGYWFDLSSSYGIDKALKAFEEKRYNDISKSIIKMKDIKQLKDTNVNYKDFPDTLDLMYYSQEYMSDMNKTTKTEADRELILYLFLQLGYDYLIMDIGNDFRSNLSLNALMLSNKMFTVITQDVASVGYLFRKYEQLEGLGIVTANKNSYILNKYVKSKFSKSAVESWLNVKDLITINDMPSRFYDKNATGVPLLTDSDLENGIKKIINSIYIDD